MKKAVMVIIAMVCSLLICSSIATAEEFCSMPVDTSQGMFAGMSDQEYEACVIYDVKSPEEAVQDAADAVNLLFLDRQ